MFEHGNFWGAFLRIVHWRTASAAATSAFAVFAAFAFLITLFAVPAQAAAETVDDLFLFFAHEWTYENRIGNTENGGDSANVTDAKGGESIRKIIIAAEPRFGHLGEYWELRALYDVEEPSITPHEMTAYVVYDEKGKPYVEYYINMDCLRKAAAAVPPRAPAIAYVGQKEQEAAYALAGDYAPSDVEMEVRIPPGADLIYASALAEAARADPDNGWYPIMRGAQLMHLGEWDDAIAEFQRAGACDEYEIGSLFPFDYAARVYRGNEKVSYALAGLTMQEKFHFLNKVGAAAGFPSMNYIRIKDAFREAAVGVAMGENAEVVYTALNGAACAIGAGENSDLIDRLVATVLVSLCAEYALDAMPDKPGLKDAIFAVEVELDTIKTAMKLSNNSTFNRNISLFLRLYAFAATGSPDIELDLTDYIENAEDIFSNKYLDSPEYNNCPELLKLQDMAFLAFFHEDEFFAEDKYAAEYVFRPSFERLKKLDYSSPGEWYEKWLVEKKFVREGDDNR